MLRFDQLDILHQLAVVSVLQFLQVSVLYLEFLEARDEFVQLHLEVFRVHN